MYCSVRSSSSSFALPRWEGGAFEVRRGAVGAGNFLFEFLLIHVVVDGRQFHVVTSSQRGILHIVVRAVFCRCGPCCLRRGLWLLLVTDRWHHGPFSLSC